jgi:hypothetical protein
MAHYENLERQRHEYMKRAWEQRENERKAAVDRLNSAKESEKLLAARVDEEMQKQRLT